MGELFSKPSVTKYKPSDYEKRRLGKFVYKKDKGDVYWRGDIVPLANGREFTDMGSGYGKDRKTLYYNGKTIGNMYPGFRVLKNAYAIDSRNVYFRGRLTSADPKTFQVSKTEWFAKDAYGRFTKENQKSWKNKKKT